MPGQSFDGQFLMYFFGIVNKSKPKPYAQWFIGWSRKKN